MHSSDARLHAVCLLLLCFSNALRILRIYLSNVPAAVEEALTVSGQAAPRGMWRDIPTSVMRACTCALSAAPVFWFKYLGTCHENRPAACFANPFV